MPKRLPPCTTKMLMRVLHDWSDADCRRILKNCRAAMEKGARLLICEQILEPDPARGDPILYLIGTQMMAMFGTARERSEAEFRDLMAETGFAFRRLIPTASQVFIVESVAASDENPPMDYVNGRADLEVSRFSLGCWTAGRP